MARHGIYLVSLRPNYGACFVAVSSSFIVVSLTVLLTYVEHPMAHVALLKYRCLSCDAEKAREILSRGFDSCLRQA
jgi:hypothetical protein